MSTDNTFVASRQKIGWGSFIALFLIMGSCVSSIWLPPPNVWIMIILPYALPILFILFIGAYLMWLRPEKLSLDNSDARLQPRLVADLALVTLLLISGFLAFTVAPIYLAFALTQRDFQKLQTVPLTVPKAGDQLGYWKVEEAKVDARGGLYLVTEKGDFLETFYEGFTYKPNAEGTPFGNAGYSLKKLSGDWYWFTANNDW